MSMRHIVAVQKGNIHPCSVIVGGSQKRRWPVEGSKPPENT